MSPRLKFAFALIPTLVIISFAIAACGGNDNKSSGSSPTQAPTRAAAVATTVPTTAAAAAPSATRPAGSPTAGSSGGAANNITIADFSFTPARFNATTGQQVSLNVTNSGQFPHTFTIQGVVDSGTIAAGQSKTVTFTPSAAGNLVYFCTIHGQATMSGQVMVAGTSGSAPPPAGGQTTAGAASGDSGSSSSGGSASDSTTTSYDYNY